MGFFSSDMKEGARKCCAYNDVGNGAGVCYVALPRGTAKNGEGRVKTQNLKLTTQIMKSFIIGKYLLNFIDSN